MADPQPGGLERRGQDVIGRLVMYPGEFTNGGGVVDEDASFLKVIQLIR